MNYTTNALSHKRMAHFYMCIVQPRHQCLPQSSIWPISWKFLASPLTPPYMPLTWLRCKNNIHLQLTVHTHTHNTHTHTHTHYLWAHTRVMLAFHRVQFVKHEITGWKRITCIRALWREEETYWKTSTSAFCPQLIISKNRNPKCVSLMIHDWWNTQCEVFSSTPWL